MTTKLQSPVVRLRCVPFFASLVMNRWVIVGHKHHQEVYAVWKKRPSPLEKMKSSHFLILIYDF